MRQARGDHAQDPGRPGRRGGRAAVRAVRGGPGRRGNAQVTPGVSPARRRLRQTDLVTQVNKQVRLAARPSGLPTASDWTITSEPVPAPGPGQFVVAVSYV